ncbi:MAG: hypothetical protein AAGI68_02665 [Planctomycetota bacterium]
MTAPATPSRPGLAFHGQVHITVNDQSARLTADGQRLTLHADSLTTLNALRQGLPQLPSSTSPEAGYKTAAPPDPIQDLIRKTGLHFAVVVNQHTVFELSPDHTSSLLGKALGIPGKVRPLAAFKSLITPKRDAPSQP